jgi:hypothetical protein
VWALQPRQQNQLRNHFEMINDVFYLVLGITESKLFRLNSTADKLAIDSFFLEFWHKFSIAIEF